LKGAILTALVATLVLAAPAVMAQETTGGIQGTVSDTVGTLIAGAIVEANGPLGKIGTTSDAEGRYRFPRLAAGTYVVTASFQGYNSSTAENVRVTLGENITVEFGLQKAAFEEEIMVYSDTVVIDFTESQTAMSVREWEIELLPRGRDFTDVVNFAAGARTENQGGGIMIDGASGLENKFIIDGLDTTDPQIGDSAVPMRAEFMEEVQVKSAGYMAEYGGAMGGVINAVTKSGTNEWHGSLFVDYENNDWNGSQRSELEFDLDDPFVAFLATYERDDRVRYDPGFSLGGPILRDRWWFFASYQPGLRTIDRTVDWVSFPPDVYTQDFQVDYLMLNTTVNISSALLLKGGVNFSPYTREGNLPNPDGRSDLPGQENYEPLGLEGERETYYLNLDWILGDNFVISGRGGFYHTNVEDTGIPFFDIIHNYSTGSVSGYLDRHPDIPTEWQQSAGYLSDNLQTGVAAYDTYERTAAGIDASWFFSGAGDHSLKFGYQYEEIFNDVKSGYNADRILYYWDRGYTGTTGETVNGEYGYFRLLNISEFGEVKTTNQALFIQDAWTVLPNLTLNLGVRFENEEVPNFGATGPQPAIAFGWGDKVAPRIGFAWDIANDAQWKLYGSVGKYFDVTKYEMPRGSFGGNKWVDYFYTFDTPNPSLNDAAGCRTGSNTIFERPDCPAGTFIEPIDRRHNAADPHEWELIGVPLIDPAIKPMENYELQVGLDHQLTSTSQIGVRVVHKEIQRAIEDIGFLFPGIGEVYIIGNPGEGLTADPDEDGLTFPKPIRDYNALEFTYDKRFANNWSLRAYYTLSRLEGNYSGLANSDEFGIWSQRQAVGSGARQSPNVSRLYDSILGFYNEDGNHVTGRLPTDRTHQLGGQFLYSFDFGFNVGVNQYIGSGTPISTIGGLPIGNEFYPYGRGDLGDTSWLTQTDLTLYYTFNFGRNLGLSFGLTILNLFDEDTATGVWPNTAQQDVPLTNAEVAAGFDYAAELAALGATAFDPRFEMDYAFQLPRILRFTVKFEF